MLWDGKELRKIGEADVRRLVDTGLGEHLQLEYKSALYDDNDRGNREFLLDIGMFANTSGGVLLIGVAERRDEQGHPRPIVPKQRTICVVQPAQQPCWLSNESPALNFTSGHIQALLSHRGAALTVHETSTAYCISRPVAPWHCIHMQGGRVPSNCRDTLHTALAHSLQRSDSFT